MKNVAIIGIGIINAVCDNVKRFYEVILGENFKQPEPIKVKGLERNIKAYCLNKSSLRTYEYIIWKVLDEAISDADISPEEINEDNSCLIIGTAIGNDFFSLNEQENIELVVKKMLKKFNLNMKVVVISSACTSSINALGIGYQCIRQNKKKYVFVCGCDILNDFILSGLYSCHCLSNTNMRPFDIDSSGMILGEGAGLMILKGYDDWPGVRKHYADIVECHSYSESYDLMCSDVSGRMVSSCLKSNQKMSADNMNIMVGANGTYKNDFSIYNGLYKTYGSEMPVVSDIKPLFGHMLGASGICELIAGILCMNKKVILPIVGLEKSRFELNCTLKKIKKEYNYLIHLGTSFGGNVTSIMVKRNDNI